MDVDVAEQGRGGGLVSRRVGRVAAGVVDTQPESPTLHRVPFRPARVSQLLGARVDVDEQRGAYATLKRIRRAFVARRGSLLVSAD